MRSVVKRSTIIYGIFGIVLGIVFFIYSLNSSDFVFNMDEKEIHGYKAGLIAVVFMPIIMAIVGAGHGVMFWFPFIYIYRKIMKK